MAGSRAGSKAASTVGWKVVDLADCSAGLTAEYLAERMAGMSAAWTVERTVE